MEIKSRIFAFREEMVQLRYERAVLGWALLILQWLVGITSLVVFLWMIASTSVGQMLGLATVKNRIQYGYHAIHWARKGTPSADSLAVRPERFSGTIERASQGKLLVTIYDKEGASRRIVKLSNVDVHDLGKFQGWAQAYVLKPVTLDFYIPTEKHAEHDVWAAVIWSAKKPINVELVEQNIGTPEINPLTTAVNLIFSQWYLQRALGNH